MSSPGDQITRLRWQLPLGLVTFALVPLAIVMIGGYAQSRRALLDTARSRLGAVAELKSSRVTFHLSSQVALAHNLQRRIEALIDTGPLDTQIASAWIGDLRSIPGIEVAILTLESGLVLASTRAKDSGHIWMDPPHVQAGRVETRGVGPHHLPGRQRAVASTVYLPLHDPSGRSRAELVVVGEGSILKAWLSADLPATASATLVDFREEVVSRWEGPAYQRAQKKVSAHRWLQPGGARIVIDLSIDTVLAPLSSILKSGAIFFVLMALFTGALALLLARRMVTREMLFQTRLAHQERMAAVGNLAAGVAHEIGNPLASISAAIQMQVRRTQDHDARRDLDLLLGELDRIHRSVRNLARLSRSPGKTRRPILLQDVISRAISLARYDPRARGVEWIEALDGDAPPILADEDAWLQLCLNLMVNALDALEDRPARTIRLELRRQGEFLVFTVRDSGVGMSADTLRRALDPLFTTKPPSKGTGLGLALVQRVARDHGGSVLIRSEEGVFCELQVSIPISELSS